MDSDSGLRTSPSGTAHDEDPAQRVGAAEGAPATAPGSAAPPESTPSRRGRAPARTRMSAAFLGAVAAVLLLILLLIFMLENTESVAVHFLGAHGHLALGLALLVAAVAGALIVSVLGLGRIVQLRRATRRLR